MEMSRQGYLRPVKVAPISRDASAAIEDVCPALKLDLRSDSSAIEHKIWGPIVKSRVGWSGDSEVRRMGSSGGGISSLLLHLLETKQIDFAAHIGTDARDPLRNVVQQSRTRADIIRASGSRYAPAAPLENVDLLFASGEKFAFVGKPCDAAAMRAYIKQNPHLAHQVVAVLSFMCAGVPSIRGTHQVLDAMGTSKGRIVSFRYRGDGWPGYATAVDDLGATFRMDYNSSWGNILGKHLQLRCKVCPDGTGEFADVVCADAWHGKDGYPDFEERDGRSLLLTRTSVGEDVVLGATQRGDLVTEDLDPAEIDRMQPYQVTRKRVVIGRLLAVVLKRHVRPRYRGLRLVSNVMTGGLGPALRNAWGTFKRLERSGYSDG
jgi:coenzyme F420 hydrogenase subunit beta